MINLIEHQHQGEADDSDTDVEWKNLAFSFLLCRCLFVLLLFGDFFFVLLVNTLFLMFNGRSGGINFVFPIIQVEQVLSNRVTCFSENLRQSNACDDADSWSKSKHQSNHDTREIGRQNSVNCDENLAVGDVLDQKEIVPGRHQQDQIAQVEEVV